MLRGKGFALEEAEEIVQETFLKLYQSASNFRDVESPKAYVYRVVLNCANDFLRRQRKADPEVAVEPGEIERAADVREVTDSSAFDGFMDCFEAAYSRFENDAPESAFVVRLAIVEGMSGKELAVAIGRSYGAAREFLSQTRKKFQALLSRMCSDYMSDGEVS